MKLSCIAFSVVLLVLSVSHVNGSRGMLIFGGRAISMSEFGYQMQYVIRNRTICGACLLSNTWALTAAHCTDIQKTGITLIGGSTKPGVGVTIPVLRLIQHPDYSPKTFVNDVSLLSFAPIKISSSMFPIRLPSKDQVFPEGTTCVVSGFGLTENGKPVKMLLGTDITISDQTSCVINYAKARFSLTDNMLCAGSVSGKQDSCSGDSVRSKRLGFAS